MLGVGPGGSCSGTNTERRVGRGQEEEEEPAIAAAALCASSHGGSWRRERRRRRRERNAVIDVAGGESSCRCQLSKQRCVERREGRKRL